MKLLCLFFTSAYLPVLCLGFLSIILSYQFANRSVCLLARHDHKQLYKHNVVQSWDSKGIALDRLASIMNFLPLSQDLSHGSDEA